MSRRLTLRVGSIVAIISAGGLACNSGEPASAACDGGDQCQSGTQCLASLEIGPTGACTPSASMTCTAACATDSDCGALVDPANGKNDFSCVVCGTSGTCAIIAGAITLLPPGATCTESSQCQVGLDCLSTPVQGANGTCTSDGVLTCTISCGQSSECESLVDPSDGLNDLSCYDPCQGLGVCGLVQ